LDTVIATTDEGTLTSGELLNYIWDVGGRTVYRELRDNRNMKALEWVPRQYLAYPVLAASAEEEGIHQYPEIIADIAARTDEALLSHLMLEEVVRPSREVNPRTWFEEHPDLFHVPEKITIRHIFLRVPRGAAESDWDAAEKQASELVKRVRAGEEFTAVAADAAKQGIANNANPAAVIEPDLAKMNPDLKAYCLEFLEPGETGEPIRTSYGVEVIQLVSHTESRDVTFEEVRKDVKEIVRQARTRELYEDLSRRAARKFAAWFASDYPDILPDDPDTNVVRLGKTEFTARQVADRAVRLGLFAAASKESASPERRAALEQLIPRMQRALLARSLDLDETPEFRRHRKAVREQVLAREWLNRETERRFADAPDAVLAAHLAEMPEISRIPALSSGWEIVIPWGVDQDEATPPDIFLAREKAEALARATAAAIRAGTPVENLADTVLAEAAGRATVRHLPLMDHHSGSYFDAHAGSLQPGAVAEPVSRGTNTYVYVLEDLVPARDASLDDVRNEVLKSWQHEKRKELERDIVEFIVESKNLSIDEDALVHMFDEYWEP
jgi:hypothetical protein